MRVCLVSYEFPPNGGGEASYVDGLATGLAKTGHEVTVLTPREGMTDDETRPFSIVPLDRGRAPIRGAGFLAAAEKKISRLASQGSIEVVHVTFDYPTFLFRLRQSGLPCVATVHHLHVVEALAMLPHERSVAKKVTQMLKASALTTLEGRLVRQCRAVIAVSGFTAETVRRFLSTPREDIRLVKNGIDASDFGRGDPERFRDRFPGLGDKTVLYVGRLERSKGLQYLIPAFACALSRVPEAKMAIVGKGSNEYVRELMLSARSAGVSDKIVFTGRIPQDLLPDAYAASALVALPSLMEGFGISLLEAMASGRPCVATRVGAIPEILKDQETGLLVKPSDSQDLGDAMATLLSDQSLGTAMGMKGREVVKRDFGLERMTTETLSVYDEVLTGARDD